MTRPMPQVTARLPQWAVLYAGESRPPEALAGWSLLSQFRTYLVRLGASTVSEQHVQQHGRGALSRSNGVVPSSVPLTLRLRGEAENVRMCFFNTTTMLRMYPPEAAEEEQKRIDHDIARIIALTYGTGASGNGEAVAVSVPAQLVRQVTQRWGLRSRWGRRVSTELMWGELYMRGIYAHECGLPPGTTTFNNWTEHMLRELGDLAMRVLAETGTAVPVRWALAPPSFQQECREINAALHQLRVSMRRPSQAVQISLEPVSAERLFHDAVQLEARSQSVVGECEPVVGAAEAKNAVLVPTDAECRACGLEFTAEWGDDPSVLTWTHRYEGCAAPRPLLRPGVREFTSRVEVTVPASWATAAHRVGYASIELAIAEGVRRVSLPGVVLDIREKNNRLWSLAEGRPGWEDVVTTAMARMAERGLFENAGAYEERLTNLKKAPADRPGAPALPQRVRDPCTVRLHLVPRHTYEVFRRGAIRPTAKSRLSTDTMRYAIRELLILAGVWVGAGRSGLQPAVTTHQTHQEPAHA